jgi:hypothetical protein
MELPKNKDGKIYLLDKEGNEVTFQHPIDLQEALFGVFGKDDGKEPEFFLPDGFDMKLRPQKNAIVSKDQMIDHKLSTGKRGRPRKEVESTVESNEDKSDSQE